MGSSFSARGRSSKLRRVSPRTTAVLGIFAILFQAMLGAWHHHALPFSSPAAAAVIASAPASQEMPEAADQNCRICFALSHHGAVPVDLFAAALPDQNPLPQMRAAEIASPLCAYFLFQARAPPRA